MDEQEVERLMAAAGKTIASIEYLSPEGMGACDEVTLHFTDGTAITLVAFWCNDNSAGIELRS